MQSEEKIELLNPYKGDEPYIFVSYAHKNSAEVLKVISCLQKANYRVWFDDGIDPGTEWDENIAAHISECAYFIAFISEEYLASSNCKDEINFARDKEKPRLLVYLHDTQLPEGMSMRLNRLQAIHKYTYKDDEDFCEKLFEADGIKICLDGSGQPVHGSAREYTMKTGERPAKAPANGRANRKTATIAAAAAVSCAIIAAVIIFLAAQNSASPQVAVQSTETSASVTAAPAGNTSAVTSTEAPQIATVPENEADGSGGVYPTIGMTYDEFIDGNSFLTLIEKSVNSDIYYYAYNGATLGDYPASLLLWFDSEKGLTDYRYVISGDKTDELYSMAASALGKPVTDTGTYWEWYDAESGAYQYIELASYTDASYTYLGEYRKPDAPADSGEFMRELSWGMTVDEAKAAETAHLTEEKSSDGKIYLVYSDVLYEQYSSRMTLRFDGNGSLDGIYYLVPLESYNKICDNLYKESLEELKRLYGAPDEEEEYASARWNDIRGEFSVTLIYGEEPGAVSFCRNRL